MLCFVNKPGEDFNKALAWLNKNTVYGVDTETNGLNPFTSNVLLLQIGNEKTQWVFDTYYLEEHLPKIFKYLTDPNKIKILHNAQFDYKMLKANYGIELNNMRCTMLMEQLLTKGKRISASLAACTAKYTRAVLDKTERLTFVSMKYGDKITKEQVKYAGDDTKYLIPIYKEQNSIIELFNMETVAELENSAIKVFGDMSLNGIYLNKNLWLPLEEKAMINVMDLKEKLNLLLKPQLEKRAEEDLFGTRLPNINYDSPTQVLPLLKEATGIPLENTNAKYLEIFKDKNEIIATLIKYRQEQKKITTYGAVFLNNIESSTGRIHSEFKQIHAETGRTSSENPKFIGAL